MTEKIVVTVETGSVHGAENRNYHGGKFYSFSGIPYANAPIGELRFKAPVSCEPWTGVRDGTKDGAECPSKDLFFGVHNGDENNCLNLNIYTRELPIEKIKKNPVMVFIHGGGFVSGSNKRMHSGPEYLMTENIVLVIINYRLGVFGFLSLEDPSLGIPGNAGLKDQVFALKWVQRNIHHFGGDPDNVTIFGESAGSASVHYLTLSPLAKGLFHKAIMQSGSALNTWARGRRNALDIAEGMGYGDTDEKIILEKLRVASAKSIVNGLFKKGDCYDASQVRPFGPVIEYPHEGAFLTEDPIAIMESGRSHQIPIIIGYNSLEGMLYEIIRRSNNVGPLAKSLESDVSYKLNISHESLMIQEVAKHIKDFYYKNAEISDENIRNKYLLFGDIIFLYGIQMAARLLKLHGTAPVYVYRLSLECSLNYFKSLCETRHIKTFLIMKTLAELSSRYLGGLVGSLANRIPSRKIEGVSHADDLFFLFKLVISSPVIVGSDEDKYIQRFVKSWTNFAKYGNPTPDKDHIFDNVVWKPIESEKIDNIFDFNKTITITENWESERIAFLDKLYQDYAK